MGRWKEYLNDPTYGWIMMKFASENEGVERKVMRFANR